MPVYYTLLAGPLPIMAATVTAPGAQKLATSALTEALFAGLFPFILRDDAKKGKAVLLTQRRRGNQAVAGFADRLRVLIPKVLILLCVSASPRSDFAYRKFLN